MKQKKGAYALFSVIVRHNEMYGNMMIVRQPITFVILIIDIIN